MGGTSLIQGDYILRFSEDFKILDFENEIKHSLGPHKHIFRSLFVDQQDKPTHLVTSQRADFLHCVFLHCENGSSSINKG